MGERGFVLTPTYRTVGGRPQVQLFAILESGEPALVTDDRFRPYFFVPADATDLASTRGWTATLLLDSDPEEAARLFREAIPILRKTPSRGIGLYTCLLGLGQCDVQARRFREAAESYTEAVELSRGDPAKPRELVVALQHLASTRYEAAELDLAEAPLRELLSAGTGVHVAYALNLLAVIRYVQNDLAEAELDAEAAERFEGCLVDRPALRLFLQRGERLGVEADPDLRER